MNFANPIHGIRYYLNMSFRKNERKYNNINETLKVNYDLRIINLNIRLFR